MPLLLTILISLFFGGMIGVLAGMLGIGGGMLMVPLLRIGFGLVPAVCSGTSLLIVILTSTAGAATHLRNKTASFQIGMITGITGALFSVVGATVTSVASDLLITLTAVAIMAYAGSSAAKKAFVLFKKDAREKKSVLSETELIEKGNEESAQLESKEKTILEEGQFIGKDVSSRCFLYKGSKTKTALISVGVGMIAGFFGGFVGVGGGFVMIPCFTNLFGMKMKEASGTSLVAILMIAISGSIRQASLGNIAFLPGLLLGLAAIPGAVLGANVVNRIPEKYARAAFVVVIASCITLLLLKQFGVL